MIQEHICHLQCKCQKKYFEHQKDEIIHSVCGPSCLFCLQECAETDGEGHGGLGRRMQEDFCLGQCDVFQYCGEDSFKCCGAGGFQWEEPICCEDGRDQSNLPPFRRLVDGARICKRVGGGSSDSDSDSDDSSDDSGNSGGSHDLCRSGSDSDSDSDDSSDDSGNSGGS